MRGRNPYRKRLEALKDVWSIILQRDPETVTREEVLELLKRTYANHGIPPLKGKAFPEDIYDKELTSLYVVGAYGLGLRDEYPELFERLFDKERRYEEAVRELLSGNPPERVRSRVEELVGKVDSNKLARIFRVLFTKVVFGFERDERMAELLKRSLEVFPEMPKTPRSYAKFYVAFKVAEAIAAGSVRDRVTKEAVKQALSIMMGFEKSIPDDRYILHIAREVFKVPKRRLASVLALDQDESG